MDEIIEIYKRIAELQSELSEAYSELALLLQPEDGDEANDEE